MKCGIGQEAHVGNHVSVLGKTLPESEAHAGDQEAFFRGLLLETFGDVSAKLVHVELRSVDDEIGDCPNGAQVAAFRFERGLHRRVCAQGMRPARLAEAAHENGVGSFEEDDLGRDHARNRLQYLGKFVELGAFTHVHHQRGAANLARLDRQVGELRDELHRQVIDAVVAQVLEGLQHRGFARTAHAGNDHQFRRMRRGAGGILPRTLRIFPFPARGLTGLHELDSSIRAKTVL